MRHDLSEIYDKILSEAKIKKGGNDLNDKFAVQDGGPSTKGGYKKTLHDKVNDCGCDEEDEEDEECGCDGECECDHSHEPIKESLKKDRTSLNIDMSKQRSIFDKLYRQITENFDQDDDIDALGLGDATPDSDLDDDFGGDDEFDSEDDGDSVTFTLDRTTAQALVDVLQGALGGEGGDEDLDFGDDDGDEDLDFGDDDGDEDLDFGDDDEGEDEEFDFEEDEETIGAKDAKGGSGKHNLQGKNNKVKGAIKASGGKATPTVTDKVGNDGDKGHALKGGTHPLQGKDNKVKGTLRTTKDFFQ